MKNLFFSILFLSCQGALADAWTGGLYIPMEGRYAVDFSLSSDGDRLVKTNHLVHPHYREPKESVFIPSNDSKKIEAFVRIPGTNLFRADTNQPYTSSKINLLEVMSDASIMGYSAGIYPPGHSSNSGKEWYFYDKQPEMKFVYYGPSQVIRPAHFSKTAYESNKYLKTETNCGNAEPTAKQQALSSCSSHYDTGVCEQYLQIKRQTATGSTDCSVTATINIP